MGVTLSIVIPIYQSELVIPELVHRLTSWMHKTNYTMEFVFVNDHSPDNSEHVLLAALANAGVLYRYISLAKNYGQHTATAIGMKYSTGQYVATIDDDLQHNPEDVGVLLQHIIYTHCDLVYGTYETKKHSAFRNAGTRILQWLLRKEGRKFSMVTSLRVMKRQVLQMLPEQPQKIFFLDDVLLLASAKVDAVTVTHSKRKTGKSGYSWFKLVNMALSILLLHSSFPLRLISRSGLFISVVFFLVGCYYIYKKYMFDAVLGYTSIIVAIFFSTGLILFSLGIIGEYIRRMWEHAQRLDAVIIEKNIKNGE
ncbi:MAG: glycosyltransferase [Bacteroidota bacterium]|jgi:glycosyltransferase involved in cell wall biosynthesis